MTDINLSPRELGGISVPKLVITLGMTPGGDLIQQTHLANETRKIWVFPGRYARIETASPHKAATSVVEIALTPLGWQYERS
jgi:hypothetical protein